MRWNLRRPAPDAPGTDDHVHRAVGIPHQDALAFLDDIEPHAWISHGRVESRPDRDLRPETPRRKVVEREDSASARFREPCTRSGAGSGWRARMRETASSVNSCSIESTVSEPDVVAEILPDGGLRLPRERRRRAGPAWRGRTRSCRIGRRRRESTAATLRVSPSSPIGKIQVLAGKALGDEFANRDGYRLAPPGGGLLRGTASRRSRKRGRTAPASSLRKPPRSGYRSFRDNDTSSARSRWPMASRERRSLVGSRAAEGDSSSITRRCPRI